VEMGAKSAPKTTKWGQKAPPHKSEPKKCGGKKSRQNAKVNCSPSSRQLKKYKFFLPVEIICWQFYAACK